MRLIEAELYNICQHKYLNIQFSKGLTCFIGPNGSGKSNALAAIYFAITGDTSRFRLPNRQSVINQFALMEEQCGVRLTMEHHGVTATIERYIKPSRRQLLIGNSKPIYSDKEITEKLEAWFGMPMKTIGQYVFVDQWEMFSLLNQAPGERAKDLFRLFGIDKAEECHNVLGDRISSLSSSGPILDIDAIRTRLVSQRTKLRDFESKLSQINLRADYDQSKDPNLICISRYTTMTRLSSELQKLELEVDALYQKKYDKETELDDFQVGCEQYEVRLANMVLASDKAKLELANWNAYEQVTKNKQEIQRKLDKLTSDLNQLILPVRPKEYEENDEKFKSNLFQCHKRAADAISYLEKIGDGSTCPTCGACEATFEDKRSFYKADLEEAQKRIAEIDRIRSLSDQYREAKVKYMQRKGVLDANSSFLVEQLNLVIDLPTPSGNKEQLGQMISDFKLLELKVSLSKQEIERAKQLLSHLNGQISKADEEVKKKKFEWEASYEDKDAYDNAICQLELNRTLSKERSTLISEISVLKSAITDNEVSIEEAAESIQKQQQVETLKSELTIVRSILHHKALPKDIAQSHLEQLEEQINLALCDLGVDFRVKSQDGLKFLAEFHDGRKVFAESLSGGEKVVFALAWRLAVNAKFSNDIGLLCLDEPTAGLDKDRLGCLRITLEKMKLMSQSRGLQCLIVSHEKDLMPMFDQVIELKAPVFS